MDITLSLPPELVHFLEERVRTGRARSSSDAVRQALELLEREESDGLAWLRQAWADGLSSGDASPFDMDAIKRDARAQSRS